MSDNNQKFVIFDLDGTLIDSYDCIIHCINQALEVLNLTQLGPRDCNLPKPIHKILDVVETNLVNNKITLKKFYSKFDSIQLSICQRKAKYYPKVITLGNTLLNSYISHGYKVVILTNKAQNIANAIIKCLFKEYDLIVIGRRSTKRIKNEPNNVLSRLNEYNLNIDNCIAYHGDSVEDALLATKLGLNNFKLMHNCSNIQLRSFNDSELGVGLSYISALIKVFNHISTSSITNPKYIFRGVTQRYFYFFRRFGYRNR